MNCQQHGTTSRPACAEPITEAAKEALRNEGAAVERERLIEEFLNLRKPEIWGIWRNVNDLFPRSRILEVLGFSKEPTP